MPGFCAFCGAAQVRVLALAAWLAVGGLCPGSGRGAWFHLQRVRGTIRPATQALALAWAAPYAAECNAITAALALSFVKAADQPGLAAVDAADVNGGAGDEPDHARSSRPCAQY